MHYIDFTTTVIDDFGIHEFYPTGFSQWVKRAMPTLIVIPLSKYVLLL